MTGRTCPAGSTIVLTYGIYDGFGINEAIVTLADCDMDLLRAQFLEQDAGPKCEAAFDFAPWLIEQGHARKADVQTLHLGDYDFDFTDNR
jgi:hypothetical protein